MSIDYLRFYQASLTRKAARSVMEDPERDPNEEFPEVSFPPVIVLSGGTLISGRIAGPDGYNARLRQVLRQAPGSDPEALEDLMVMFPAQTVLSREQLASEELPSFEHLYLVDVRTYQGTRVINIPAFVVRFDAIDGWNIGVLPQ
ncbi:hypothetical protein SAMN04488058_11260 [Deinococcus reticulitermitis]|uniref:Uncharacterized protein n=1 Tax=Deinococcus reticulitermitis TaxID=856736 RepID=A0A1H7ADR2_9DEIO|nr:hypothetical protein [Deinococcus reticulitermitis]SEJ62684.1 hypothetical protein SAMN04488058_11260 [Deinococcus reticulitermitis]